jgi:hypothetical protein
VAVVGLGLALVPLGWLWSAPAPATLSRLAQLCHLAPAGAVVLALGLALGAWRAQASASRRHGGPPQAASGPVDPPRAALANAATAPAAGTADPALADAAGPPREASPTTVASPATRRPPWWLGGLLAVTATWAVTSLVPPRFRVQFDETCLAGVAQNLHHQRLAVMTTGALLSGGVVVPLENMVDKRPTLQALLVSVLHDVCGEAPGHVFTLNAALLAIALFVAYLVAGRQLGLAGALSAPLLLLAVPLTVIVATSGGFELLAALALGLVLLAAHAVATRPDGWRWANFVGVGVVFAWSRYESLPALLVIGVLLGWRTRGRGLAAWPARVALGLAPALLAPLWPLLQHAQNPKFYPEAAGAPLLAWAHGLDHLPAFVAAWFAPGLANAFPGLLAWFAVAAASIAVAQRVRRGARLPFAAWLVGLPLTALTLLMLFWFYGDVQEPTAWRLFLPAAWATALAPLLLFALLPGTKWRRVRLAMVLGVAVLACLRVQRVATGAAFPPLQFAAWLEPLTAAVESMATDRRTTLWVGTPAQQWIVLGHAAISARTFLQRRREVMALVRQGDVRTIYVVTSPLDAAMAAELGDPAEVVRMLRSEVVQTVAGRDGFTVRRVVLP